MEGRQSWQKRSLRKLPTSDIAKYSQQNITIGHMLIFRPTLEKSFFQQNQSGYRKGLSSESLLLYLAEM